MIPTMKTTFKLGLDRRTILQDRNQNVNAKEHDRIVSIGY